MPDRFKRQDTLEIPGGMHGGSGMSSPAIVTVSSGSEGWREVVGGGGGAVVMIRRPSTGDPAAEGVAARRDLALYVLGITGQRAANFPLEFTHAGIAEAPDGKAEVLEMKGPNNFSGRLFVDAVTHLPLMLSYQGVAPQARVRTAQGPAPSGEERDKRIADEARTAEAEGAAPPPTVEMQIRFEERRQTGGAMLPHRVTVSAAGKVVEEWEFERFEVNKPIDPKQFTRKSKS